jgi:hypothetical protein
MALYLGLRTLASSASYGSHGTTSDCMKFASRWIRCLSAVATHVSLESWSGLVCKSAVQETLCH